MQKIGERFEHPCLFQIICSQKLCPEVPWIIGPVHLPPSSSRQRKDLRTPLQVPHPASPSTCFSLAMDSDTLLSVKCGARQYLHWEVLSKRRPIHLLTNLSCISRRLSLTRPLSSLLTDSRAHSSSSSSPTRQKKMSPTKKNQKKELPANQHKISSSFAKAQAPPAASCNLSVDPQLHVDGEECDEAEWPGLAETVHASGPRLHMRKMRAHRLIRACPMANNNEPCCSWQRQSKLD